MGRPPRSPQEVVIDDALAQFDDAQKWRWISQHAAAIEAHRRPEGKRQIAVVLSPEWDAEVERLDADKSLTDADRFQELIAYADARGIGEVTHESLEASARRALQTNTTKQRNT